MTQELTERQSKILDFIKEYVLDNGYPPSIREIGKGVGISSTSVVKYNLEKLAQLGYIILSGGIARGLRLASRPGIVEVPLLGYIRASEPLPSYDTFSDEMVELTMDIVKEPEMVYALRVQGNSMQDVSINDGDLVVLKYQHTAEPGDLVAAWLGPERGLTLKRFYPEGEYVRLQPENEAYKPIIVPVEEVEVQGKVIAVIRRLE